MNASPAQFQSLLQHHQAQTYPGYRIWVQNRDEYQTIICYLDPNLPHWDALPDEWELDLRAWSRPRIFLVQNQRITGYCESLVHCQTCSQKCATFPVIGAQQFFRGAKLNRILCK